MILEVTGASSGVAKKSLAYPSPPLPDPNKAPDVYTYETKVSRQVRYQRRSAPCINQANTDSPFRLPGPLG